MLVFISWTWFRSGKHESTFTPRLHLLCFHFLYVTFWNEMENAIREVHHFPHLQSPSPTLTVAHTNSSREWNPLIPTLPYILQEQSHLHFILSLTFHSPWADPLGYNPGHLTKASKTVVVNCSVLIISYAYSRQFSYWYGLKKLFRVLILLYAYLSCVVGFQISMI